MKQQAQKLWHDARNILNRRALRRGAMVAVLIVSFLFGYNGTSSYVQSCQAQIPPIPGFPVTGATCGCGWMPTVPCTYIGSTSIIAVALEAELYTALSASAAAIENYESMAIDTMVEAIFSRLDQMERDIIAWWETMWHYNQRPGMQAATEQLNVATLEQARETSTAQDATQANQTASVIEARQPEAAAESAPSEQTCAVGTVSGGFGRAAVFSKAIRRAMQNSSAATGLNKTGTPSEKGSIAMVASHAEEFEDTFCDPSDNDGKNTCAGSVDPAFYNADTQVTERLYNPLTIPMQEDEKVAKAIEHIIDNMVGRARANPIASSVVGTTAGTEIWMQRRSYTARKNALRALPQLMTGWRTPGSQMGEWTKGLREGAGIKLDDISENPSYKEILHALTVDRFNSGQYAVDQIGDPSKQMQEKVMLNALYLMQLRDYYELLERTALALAVQVSVLADQYPMPDPATIRPVR